ncbi:MAG: flagellar basal body P-ring formation protein FlgA [Limnochordales bacterium]|nr:flagellar basal body P-ring formation protein FlgA [Limnochordales bacterium]
MWGGLLLLCVSLISSTAQAQAMPGPVASASSAVPTRTVQYRVELQESARVTEERVYLRDIAQITAVGGEDEELESLAAVEVGRVPLVGQTIRIPAGYVLVKLRQARVSLDLVSVEFPPSGSITVNRAAADTAVAGEAAKGTAAAAATAALVERARADLIEAIRTRAEKDGRLAGASWEVEIDGIIGLETQIEQLLRGAAGGELVASQTTEHEIRQRPKLSWDLGSWVPVPGRFTLFARLRSETSAREYPVTVYGTLKVNVAVVVARSDLPAGKLLGPEDVELKPMAGDRLLSLPGVLTSLEDAYGRQLERDVAAGEPVRSSWLTAPLVFRRGDRLPVTVQNGSVRVTVLLEALEDGRVGALVRCRNADTGKVVMVRVTPEGPVPAFTVVSS